jgi:hypothetical protein
VALDAADLLTGVIALVFGCICILHALCVHDAKARQGLPAVAHPFLRSVRLRSKGVVVSDRGKGIVKDVRYVLRR